MLLLSSLWSLPTHAICTWLQSLAQTHIKMPCLLDDSLFFLCVCVCWTSITFSFCHAISQSYIHCVYLFLQFFFVVRCSVELLPLILLPRDLEMKAWDTNCTNILSVADIMIFIRCFFSLFLCCAAVAVVMAANIVFLCFCLACAYLFFFCCYFYLCCITLLFSYVPFFHLLFRCRPSQRQNFPLENVSTVWLNDIPTIQLSSYEILWF